MRRNQYQYQFLPGRITFIIALVLCISPFSLIAEDTQASLKKELEAMKLEVSELRSLVERLQGERKPVVAPQPTQISSREWREIYSKSHLAGYADFGFSDQESEDGTFNVGTFAPIFHYLYRDLMLLESELEIEVEDDGGTETNLEYLALDLFLNDYMALIGGKFLSPLGQFRQNLHPGWINKLPSEPIGFAHGQAAPTDEIGIQLRGGLPIGERRLNYALFVANGPTFEEGGHEEEQEIEEEEEGHEEEGELAEEMVSLSRSGASDGEAAFEIESSPTDSNSNKVLGGRLGFLPVDNLEVGISGVTGDADSDDGDRNYDVYGADLTFQYTGLDFKGEYVKTSVGAASESDEEDIDLEAWYLQAAYKLPFAPKFEAVVRWGSFDLPGVERTQWTAGFNYLFANNIITKIAYDFNNNDGAEDLDRFMAQLAYGF